MNAGFASEHSFNLFSSFKRKPLYVIYHSPFRLFLLFFALLLTIKNFFKRFLSRCATIYLRYFIIYLLLSQQVRRGKGLLI